MYFSKTQDREFIIIIELSEHMNIKSFTFTNIVYHSEILLDSFRGLDFLKAVQPESVGLDSKSAYRSTPSGDKYLKRLLSDFYISQQDSIIDVGCGKGSAVRTMLQFPFKRADGIELSSQIANIAQENFNVLNVLNRCHIFIGDASLFGNYDDYNFVYLYNPFPRTVMVSVIEALIQSLVRIDRELIIIYNNPTCHDVVIANDVFQMIGEYPDSWGHGISIYSNRNHKSSRLYKKR